jgi:hypothetical protein
MTEMSKERFEEELAKRGVRPQGGYMTPPALVRDIADGVLYANGLSSVHRDSEGFARGAQNSILNLAEHVLEWHRIAPNGGPWENLNRALTTTDFASVLGAAGEALVRAAYDQQPLAHRTFARRGNVKNYRAAEVAVVSAGAALEHVPEGGDIPQRSPRVETAPLSVDMYGGIMSLSRQVLINDSLGVVAEMARQRGNAAAETERSVIWKLVGANAGSFFSAGNGNAASAAAGATVSATTLGLARTALRNQVAADGTVMGSRLAYIVAGPATENAWEALLSGRHIPATSGAVPAEMAPPKVLIEPSIKDESWFAFPDYRLGPTAIEYVYLGDGDGLRFDQKVGFATEGVVLRITLEFGAALSNKRAAFRMAQA